MGWGAQTPLGVRRGSVLLEAMEVTNGAAGQTHYSRRLRTAYRRFLLCCIAWKERERTHRPMSYAEAITRACCDEFIEAAVGKRRLQQYALRDSSRAWKTDRLPKVDLLKELEEGVRYSEGQEYGRLNRLQWGPTAFGIVTGTKGWDASIKIAAKRYDRREVGVRYFTDG